MINWITDNLATAPKNEINENIYKIIDVRDMVDKEGNPVGLILEKIDTAIKLIKNGHKVIICCDCGLSRSNAIAAGILVKYSGYNFEEAVKSVLKKSGQHLIELGLLNSVRKALRIFNKKSKNKTILITGADGFIGSALCNLLKDKYHLITPKKSEIDLTKGPIELDWLVKKFSPNVIVHLANPKVCTTNQAMSEMILMLKNILDVCRENKIPIIFPSSWAVFSGYKNRLLITVQSSLLPNPGDTYGQANFFCEVLLNQYKENYGVNVAIIRFSQVYGPRNDRPNLIWNFFEKAKKNFPIYTHEYENGLPTLDLLYIEDATAAIKAVIQKKFYGTINIGSGKSISTFEIAQRVKKICDSESKISLQKINDYHANIIINISRAKKILNWSPNINIDNGLAKVFLNSKNHKIV